MVVHGLEEACGPGWTEIVGERHGELSDPLRFGHDADVRRGR
jgi:hypothetical protein